MAKIYKITNIALIFTLVGVVLCAEPTFSSTNSLGLRVPLKFGKENKKTISSRIIVETISPSTEEFMHYIGVFGEIILEETMEEMNEIHTYQEITDLLDSYDKSKVLTINKFVSLEENLASALSKLEDSDILALFVAKDINGKVIGAELAYKSKYFEKGIKTIGAVVTKYQGQDIGIMFKNALLKWLVENAGWAFFTTIDNDNRASSESLKKSCKELGLLIQSIPSEEIDAIIYIVSSEYKAIQPILESIILKRGQQLAVAEKFIEAAKREGNRTFQFKTIDFLDIELNYSEYDKVEKYLAKQIEESLPHANGIILKNVQFSEFSKYDSNNILLKLMEVIRKKLFPISPELKEALKEAVKNGVIYGNGNKPNNIVVVRWWFEGERFVVDIIDQGREAINFYKFKKLPRGLPLSLQRERGYSDWISKFIASPPNSKGEYNFPLRFDPNGEQLGQIVRLEYTPRNSQAKKITSLRKIKKNIDGQI
ncbi:MAG: hypothetical protein P9L93_01985 [Candidatus Gorgyraea atricola]|nr:hypothetical protein [Candidatus Gorgyraea atricola]